MSLVRIDPAPGSRFPSQPLLHLDALWVQVAGSVCNLSCTHCFVSCGPNADHHALMTREEVRGRVAEALDMGVQEIYFTGGEPFVHPEMETILQDTLALAPCSVLTNGTLFPRRRVEFLRELTSRARYSLELRVSLDGADAATHDTFRGSGAFERTMGGLRALSQAGLLPIVTVTHNTDEDALVFRERYFSMLRREGIAHPRLKVLPMFRLGRETSRTRDYAETETLALLPADAFDPTRLQCGRCRAVTSRGVFVCPLLVDEPDGRMGDTLASSTGEFELRHGACHTCWVTGMTCGNG
ncbi:MAG: radical SAM protein [Candidatus Eisenbacteria bacterium]